MRPQMLCALLSTLAMFWPVSAAPAADAKPDPTANAAMKYWQAFAQLPQIDQEQDKLLKEWSTVPFDEKAGKLLDASKVSLLYLHRGAKLPRCDWSLDFEDGPTLLMPHLEKARTLARLACLRARYEFEHGNHRAALEDVIATLILGRHAGSDPVLICILVQIAIEQQAIEAVVRSLPHLDSDTIGVLAVRLETLPTGRSVKEALLSIERDQFHGWFIKKLATVGEDQKEALHEVIVQMTADEKQAQAFLQAAGTTSPQKLIRLLKELSPSYDEMGRLLALPWDQFQAQWAVFAQKARATNPLAGLLFPALDKVAAREQWARARMALFRAALAVAQGGPDKLRAVPDPFGSGLFEYRALPQGFELKSKLLFENQPVTLTVGPAPKK